MVDKAVHKHTGVLLFLYIVLYACCHHQVVGISLPAIHTKGSLEGLSRQALIDLILGSGAGAGPKPEDSNNNQIRSTPLTTASTVKQGHEENHVTVNSLLSPNPEDKFYIYPLDKKYWWRWPKPNSSCTAHNQIGHNHAMNSGQFSVLAALYCLTLLDIAWHCLALLGIAWHCFSLLSMTWYAHLVCPVI